MKKWFFFMAFSGLLLAGCSPMLTPNFQQLTLPGIPTYYLVCPKDYCNVIPDGISPVYPVSAENLFNAFNQIVARERYTHFIYSMPEQGQFELTARSMVGLPNDVAVQFIALSDTTSTIAIYSKSRYGIFDFGGNKRRINAWLSALNSMVGQGPQ